MKYIKLYEVFESPDFNDITTKFEDWENNINSPYVGKYDEDLENNVKNIFIELEDIGLDVEVKSTIREDNNSIMVSVDGERNDKLIGDPKEYFEMFKDYMADKYTIKNTEYMYNYISNEIENVKNPSHYKWRSGEHKLYPEDLKNIVKLILKIEFE